MARTASAPERKRSLTPPSMCGLMARTLRRMSVPRRHVCRRRQSQSRRWRPSKVVDKSMRSESFGNRNVEKRPPARRPPPHVHRAYTQGATRRTPPKVRRRLGDAPRPARRCLEPGRFGPRRRGRRRAGEQVLVCRRQGFGARPLASRTAARTASPPAAIRTSGLSFARAPQCWKAWVDSGGKRSVEENRGLPTD